MLLDARQFEDLVGVRDGLKKRKYARFGYDGNAIILKAIEMRTFGGMVRFFLDKDGKPHTTGSTTQPARIKDRFIMSAPGTYVFMTQLKIAKLPPGIVAKVIPTYEIGTCGLMIGSWVTKGGHNLDIPVLCTRRMEIYPDYPFALLVFDLEQTLDEEPNGIVEEETRTEEETETEEESSEEDSSDSDS